MTTLIKIRIWMSLFIVLLVLSGITAFPISTELSWITRWWPEQNSGFYRWIRQCSQAINNTGNNYPFLAYGYDWLAFAHFVIALSFIGLYKDPVRNIWIVDWQIITCIAVIPLAFIAGSVRQIPIFHILIDCCFGIFGIIPLIICKRWINKLAATS